MRPRAAGRALGALVALSACKAEQLGVAVPRGGPQSLSPAELRGDAWRWARASPDDRDALVRDRLADMGWRAGPPPAGMAGAWCVGRGEGAVGPAVWWSAPGPLPAEQAGLQWAALISVAKAIPDEPGRPHLSLCAAPTPVDGGAASAALSGAGYTPRAAVAAFSGAPMQPAEPFGAEGRWLRGASPRPWLDLAELDADGAVDALRALSVAVTSPRD